MDRPASVEGLVVTGWVDGQSAEELPLLGHDSDLAHIVASDSIPVVAAYFNLLSAIAGTQAPPRPD